MHALCFNYVCHVFCVNAHQCVMCNVYHDNQAGVAPQELIDSVQQRGIEPVDLEIHTMLLQYYGIVGRFVILLHETHTKLYIIRTFLTPLLSKIWMDVHHCTLTCAYDRRCNTSYSIVAQELHSLLHTHVYNPLYCD
jgi:hypothetical protein